MARSAHPELNLTIHRAPASVWDKRGWNGTSEALTATRWLVGVGGGALAVQGLRQRTFAGVLFGSIGASLAVWALTGEGGMPDVSDWFGRLLERSPWRRTDTVGETSADSFPASDAPSWTPTVGTGVGREDRIH